MSTHTSQYTLTPVAQKFILHWGEMGTRWGINRTVAQIHALLYLSPKAVPAQMSTRFIRDQAEGSVTERTGTMRPPASR